MSEQGPQRAPFAAWLKQPQTIIALSALLLSLCGLFIAIYEATLIRRAQRASVWPHVQVATSVSGESRVAIWVQNTGVGPARIEAAALRYDGEPVDRWRDLIDRVVGDVRSAPYTYSLINGRVLPVGSEGETIFEVEAENGATAEAIVALGRAALGVAIEVTVCYCSVYDECWITGLGGMLGPARAAEEPTGPREVDDCRDTPRSGI